QRRGRPGPVPGGPAGAALGGDTGEHGQGGLVRAAAPREAGPSLTTPRGRAEREERGGSSGGRRDAGVVGRPGGVRGGGIQRGRGVRDGSAARLPRGCGGGRRRRDP